MKLTLNLATRNYLDRRKVYLTYGVLLTIFGIFLVFNVMSVVHTQMQMQTVRGHLKEIGVESVDEPTVNPAEVQRVRSQIEFANEILSRESFRWTKLLNHLEEMVRRGITIESLRPDYRDRSLRVTGLARNLGDFKSFISRVQSSAHFETVYLYGQTRKEIETAGGGKKTAIGFSLQLKGAF
ncbi:MAG: hypothetical protein GWO11_07380 [Desulfuromonadales bacterium]|nr:hypothetical protein [Desulfuromonadales bacterium]NIR34150.1 hypothetical protein [Desulfuromonadales bacterium]NIS40233.1 hypothetical protein [Desulfuromonadales bacterium]